MFGLKQMFNLKPGDLIVKKSDSKYFWYYLYYHINGTLYNILCCSSEEKLGKSLNKVLFFLRIIYINDSKYLEFLSGTNVVIIGTWMPTWESFNSEWENISDTK